MDYKLREIQRRIAMGEPQALEELDIHLQRAGYELSGETHEHGPEPNIRLYLLALPEELYAVIIRTPDGGLAYRVEESGEVGEHIGEYFFSDAQRIVSQFLQAREPVWALEDNTCPNPHCRHTGPEAIVTLATQEGPSWDPPETRIELRCTRCGEGWTTYGGGLY